MSELQNHNRQQNDASEQLRRDAALGAAVRNALGSLTSVVVLEKAAEQYAAMKMVFAERIVRAVVAALRSEL